MTWPRNADGLPPSKYVDGEYYPDQGGYYDASRQAFVTTKPKTLVPSTTRSRTLNDYGWRDGLVSTEEIVAKSQADGWKPNDHAEKLRRLRDSDRAEDRARYNRMSPREKMSLGSYEQGLSAHVAVGRELPDGVAPPKD